MKRGEAAFSEQEQRGYQLFKASCNTCHQEPLFANGAFENTGLSVDTTLNDYGRMLITQHASDSLRFKVPTLRNIEFSYPYMHDGRFKTIRKVLNHYSDGVSESRTLADELKGGIPLSSNEKVDLTAFLLTLTDKEFLFNPDFAFPRN
jgi:cytochrome c peroxidase